MGLFSLAYVEIKPADVVETRDGSRGIRVTQALVERHADEVELADRIVRHPVQQAVKYDED